MRPQWWPDERCGYTMPGFFNGVSTVCGRPAGHEGAHWPVPLASDRPKEAA